MKGVGLTAKGSQHLGFGPASVIDLLDDPKFFHCERFRCNMLKTRCVERQDMEHLRVERRMRGSSQEFPVVGFPECKDCVQGKAICSELERDFCETREKGLGLSAS